MNYKKTVWNKPKRREVNSLMKSKGIRPRTGAVLRCLVCSKLFYVKPSSRRLSKYCSNPCRHIGQRNTITKICRICGNLFGRPASYFKWGSIRGNKDNFCSRKCLDLSTSRRRKGKLSPRNNGVWSMRQADRMFSDYIRTSADWRCYICRQDFSCKTGQLHTSHYFSRKKLPVRFDPNNCIPLCFNCHFKVESQKQHEYRNIMVERLGEEGLENLRVKSEKVLKRADAILGVMSWIEPHIERLSKVVKRKAMVEDEIGRLYYD